MYNANYMDGVPVKIAEKYKPPPAIYKLPQSLANKLNLETNYYQNSPLYSYNLQLEQKALSKIEQWKRIRQRNKELRKERIERREQQRKLEDERRQKNLLYSVSYPSTDDLSSSSGEEEKKDEQQPNDGHVNPRENGKTNIESKETAPQICVTETTNSFHNILQPTVLSNYSSNNRNITSNNSDTNLKPIIKSTFEGKLSNSFNYKDFEDDTSSPFDNIELKTINDLDVLAQVLHNTQMKSSQNTIEELDVAAATTALTENSNDTNYPEHHLEVEPQMSSAILTKNIPKPNNNCLPRFSYDFNSTQGAITELRDHHITSTTTAAAMYNANLPTISPQHHPNHQQHYQGLLNNANNYYNMMAPSNRSIDCNIQNSLNVDKSQFDRLKALQDENVIKSKSVPDILKELRDEIRNSEMRRSRNCSHNMEESSQINDISNVSTAATTPTNNDALDKSDIFSQLDVKGKQLAEQISAMGFPQTRVARIVHLVGADDKKIIEHLIPLSELADLGFEETKISEALIRHENNKNKALDDLIS